MVCDKYAIILQNMCSEVYNDIRHKEEKQIKYVYVPN